MPPKKRKRARPVYFETTIPVIRPCSRCGVWFAAGVAEGIKAEAELVVLEPHQAFWAALNHIELYVLRRTGLIHMDSNRLQGKHLGWLYPQHRCDVRWERKTRSDLSISESAANPPY